MIEHNGVTDKWGNTALWRDDGGNITVRNDWKTKLGGWKPLE